MKITINEIRTLKEHLGDDWREYLEHVMGGEDDICGLSSNESRLIAASAIDEIMRNELLSDLYVLGGCAAWFISDMTGLDADAVCKAQAHDSYELLGHLMSKNIEEVQRAMVSNDGYGHHFNHWDSGCEEITIGGKDYYLFVM